MHFIQFILCAFASVQLVTGLPAESPLPESSYPPALQGTHLLDFTKFPPLTGQSGPKERSACPFLNSAANHNIIPYNGRNIKLAWLKRLLIKVGMNNVNMITIENGFHKMAKRAHAANAAHPPDEINLSDANIHGIVEHDISYTRWDVLDHTKEQSATLPDPHLVQGMLDFAKNMTEEGKPPMMTISSLAKWRKVRHQQEKNRLKPDGTFHSPSYFLNPDMYFVGAGECAVTMTIFGGEQGIPLDIARALFQQEHFHKDFKPHVISTWKLVGNLVKCATADYVPDSWVKFFSKLSVPSWFTRGEKGDDESSFVKSIMESWNKAVNNLWAKDGEKSEKSG